MRADQLDYDLPPELVAQQPLDRRDAARLLVLDAADGRIEHRSVAELPQLLPPALWVANDTRVIEARLQGLKPTGGQVELLLVERLGEPGVTECWWALASASKPLRPGLKIEADGGLQVQFLERGADGMWQVAVQVAVGDPSVSEALSRHGRLPLPPYIRRAPEPADQQRYQTVFAAKPGAVAAPTAGLHFSKELLDRLQATGHQWTTLTLHVGPGTFAPLRADELQTHSMHAERFEVPEVTAAAIAAASTGSRPVVAVGTTVVRTLEWCAAAEGRVKPGQGSTNLFIFPPYRFRVVDALLTNFHLPRSTLLALVMAFGGIEAVRTAYAAAVAEGYRFFSYGDAMLIRRPAATP